MTWFVFSIGVVCNSNQVDGFSCSKSHCLLGLFIFSGIIFRLEPSSISQMWLESQKPSIHPMSLVCFRAFISWYLPASILLPLRRARVRCEWRNGIVPSQCNLFLQYPPATTTDGECRYTSRGWQTSNSRSLGWIRQQNPLFLFVIALLFANICIYTYIPNYIYIYGIQQKYRMYIVIVRVMAIYIPWL